MKKSLPAFFLVLTLCWAAPAAADTMSWANQVIWDAGQGVVLNTGSPSYDPTRYDPNNALGAPNSDFLSLGLGGIAIFAFEQEFYGNAIILETTYGSRAAYPENAAVYVAGSDFSGLFAVGASGYAPGEVPLQANWGLLSSFFTFAGNITNQSASGSVVDLSGLGGSPLRYVLVLDTTAAGGPSTDGFDITAVGVEGGTPEPGSLILLGSAAGMLGWWRRRRGA